MIEKPEIEEVKKSFTCPICNNLFDDATTIVECMHTFCKKCIEDKIKEEKLKACPVCDVDLGVAPLDKLRTDNMYKDMLLKLFKPKPATKNVAGRKGKAKKKKKPLPSLQVSNPVDAPLEPEKLTERVELVPYKRRQRKTPIPKRIDDIGLEPELPHKEDEINFEILLNIEQDNALAGAKEVTGEVNQNTVVIVSDGETKEVSGEKPNNNGKENQESTQSLGDKKKKGIAYSPPILRSRKPKNEDLASTSQIPVFVEVKGSTKKEVWFTLVACKNQHTDRPLPEIPARYTRTNGNMTVSYVKKLVAFKLNLESEDEVEIWLRKEPVCSTLSLHTLLDWWIMTTPMSERRSAMVGSSGEEFVMKLYYSRSHLYP